MKSDLLPHDHAHVSESEQTMADITNTANFINVADYFKQLSDGNRLRIFSFALSPRRMCDQDFRSDGYEQPCRFSSSEIVKELWANHQSAFWKRNVL